MNSDALTVALAGNPNSGKTTLFNALTGARQHVANYPGVTVETKVGRARRGGVSMEVVDLPGTYSLSAHTHEEIVARDFLIDREPAAVIDIVDASNLERNLYLATQLMELDVPLVIALNMSDVARNRGFRIDAGRLGELLGVRVVETVGHRSEGTDELLDAAIEVAGGGKDGESGRRVSYGHEVEPHVASLARGVASRVGERRSRWFALKLLEGDEHTIERLGQAGAAGLDELLAEARRLREHIEQVCGDDISAVLADRRYGFISGACAEAVHREPREVDRVRRSEQVDHAMLHPFWGTVSFIVMMYLVFQLTFTIAGPMVLGLEWAFSALGSAIGSLWPAGSDSLLRSLLVVGIFGGVGGVLGFVPNIVMLFLAVAVLEDSGYMARAAFLMDRLMHRIGLHGKSFIPMLIGFGCTVPAVLATRTLETRRDRLTTMMVVPLMSCGARLPIYMLIIPAMFEDRVLLRLGPLPITTHALLLLGVYLAGIVLAVLMAKLFRATIFRGRSVPFVMELPPYRMPTARGLALHTWERSWAYIRKAGTVILALSVVLWAMAQWPNPSRATRERFERARETIASNEAFSAAQREAQMAALEDARAKAELESSLIGRIGRGIEPVLRPAGFDWKISTALIGAFAAKEMFVAQMGIVHAVGKEEADLDDLRETLRREYSPLVGVCILLFCLISTPCVATVAVTAREAGSWLWGVFQLGYLTVLAWLVTTAVYQVGSLLGG